MKKFVFLSLFVVCGLLAGFGRADTEEEDEMRELDRLIELQKRKVELLAKQKAACPNGKCEVKIDVSAGSEATSADNMRSVSSSAQPDVQQQPKPDSKPDPKPDPSTPIPDYGDADDVAESDSELLEPIFV